MGDPVFSARLKSAAIDGIEAAGGIEAAAALTDRGKSTVGRWHSINDVDLPSIRCALLIDRVSVARGGPAFIARAMARELGFSVVPIESKPAKPADLLAAQVAIVREGGDVQVAIAQALADGEIDRGEAHAIRSEIADLIDELTKLDAQLQVMGRKK